MRLNLPALATVALLMMLSPLQRDTTYGQDARAMVDAFKQSGDWVGLRGYLKSHPDLLSIDSTDGRALRRFYWQASGLYAALTFSPEKFPTLSPEFEKIEQSEPAGEKLLLSAKGALDLPRVMVWQPASP